MKTTWMALAAVPLLLPTWPSAPMQKGQDSPKKTGLVRVVPNDAADEQGPFDREEWRTKLTQPDLAAREGAFERLAEIARRDEAARETIEQWSREERDSALAWTSRLLLRESDRSPRRTPRAWRFDPDDLGAFGSAFDLDEFQGRFEDLDSMLFDLRHDFGGLLEASPGTPGVHGRSSARSFSLESGPDGVKCKITEKVDGRDETREYEAKSMEELLQAHPALRGQIGTGPQIHLQLQPRIAPFTPFRSAPRAGEMRTDRLGIYCSPVPEGRAGIDAGRGLLVTSTEDGSLARLLGIQAGDVVVEVNGTPIVATGDVRKVLSERASGAGISVVVVDEHGERRTLTWKPKDC